jgi:hypothetical protein
MLGPMEPREQERTTGAPGASLGEAPVGGAAGPGAGQGAGRPLVGRPLAELAHRALSPATRAEAESAGRRVWGGAQVALTLARLLAEDPVLGPRYLRTAFLQGAATILLAATGLALGDELTNALADQKLGPLDQAWSVVVAMWTALWVAQLGVVALSREFHDALSRGLSLKVGLEPEDPAYTPRVRLDLRWMRAKLKRRWRAFWVLVPGIILAAVVGGVLRLPLGSWLSAGVQTALTGAWAATWWVVWTAGKSCRAWVEPVPQQPWFLRTWDRLAARHGFMQWWLPRAFGRFWHRTSLSVWAPVSVAERMPLELSGLALVRLLGVLPVVKFFVRPIVPVAAALLLERGPDAALGLEAHGDFPRVTDGRSPAT